MSVEVKVPELPESVSEATVATWHKKPGEKVDRDENVVDLETDKVMLEVPAASEGVLKEILKQEGEIVGSGDVIAILGDEGEEASSQKGPKISQQQENSQQASEEAAAASGGEEKTEETAASHANGGEAPALSPAVRKLIAEHELNPNRIQGSGKGGRIVKSDVLEYLDKSGEEERSQKAQAAGGGESKAEAPQQQVAREPAVSEGPGGRVEERVPMTRIRARIAERLVEAQRTAAILTTFNEVDLHEVNVLRDRYKEQFAKENDVRLGYMSFFVKASVEALKRFPAVNASIDGTDIVYHGYYDIGIAVSAPRGLVVPIVRDADQLTFADIERQIREFGRKARDNKLTMDDLQGGTFSITNGGVFGSMLSTPILNPPQSAILGMHNIVKRPMVVDGEIKIRPMMYLALSYDHRLIDGSEAVMFLRNIKELLEDPSRILLQI